MNITVNNIDELNAVLKIKFEKTDYKDNVDKVLREQRKKVTMKGFRTGMAPMGLVQKMYGKHILVEEINKLLSETMFDYIKNENLDILGEPLPSETEPSKVDFENESEFEFNFDICFSPKVEFNTDIFKSIPKYIIKTDDELIGKQVENLRNRFGKYVEEEISNENSLLYVFAQELDTDGNIKEGGVIKEEASILLRIIKEQEIKNQFIGKKLNDEIIVDIKKAFPNETDLAGMLSIAKEIIPELNDTFKFTVNKVNAFVPAEINQEFFDMAFGKDNVTNEEEMKAKVAAQYEKNFKLETQYKLLIDIKEKLITDIKFDIPEKFLKRWIKLGNRDKKSEITDEQIEREFPYFVDDLRWKLLKDYLVKKNNIEVTEEDVLVVVKEIMGIEFAQYGLDLSQFPEEQLETFAKERLESKKNPNDKAKFYDKAMEEKVVEFLDREINFQEKEISLDEFQKFFTPSN